VGDRRRTGLSSWRRAAFLTLAGASSVALGGCGSSGSRHLATEPASQVVKAAVKALDGSSSFHIVGTGSSGGKVLSVSLQLYRNSDVAGTIDEAGTSVRIVVVGNYTYLLAPEAFWQNGGVAPAIARQLDGRYAKLPEAATGTIDEFSYAKLAQQLTDLGNGTMSNAGIVMLDGTGVVKIDFGSGTTAGQLFVAASGTSYPVELEHSHSEGTATFSRWNQGSPPTAPTNSVTIAS
jgi:hypothetical protein